MITCQRCQTENIDGSQYCDECGAALPATSSVNKYTADDGGAAAAPEAHAERVAGETRDGDAAEARGALAADARAGAAADAGAPAAPPSSSGPIEPVEPPVERRRSPAEVIPLRHSQPVSPARTSVVGQARSRGADSSARRAAEVAAHAKLVIHRGRAVGKEFPLCEDESHIGRWDADGGIFPDVDLDSDDPEAKVSRRHARITRRGGQYYIEDLGSTNGTFVNRGRRLLPGDRQPLHDGDEVIVGKTFLKFQVLQH
jgi:FHA domain